MKYAMHSKKIILSNEINDVEVAGAKLGVFSIRKNVQKTHKEKWWSGLKTHVMTGTLLKYSVKNSVHIN